MKSKNYKSLVFCDDANNFYNFYNNLSSKFKLIFQVNQILIYDVSQERLLKKKFKNSKIIISPPKFELEKETLDPEKIINIKNFKLEFEIFSKMIDFDNTFGEAFSYNDKVSSFLKILNNIFYYFKKNKNINLLFFTHTPHNCIEILLIMIAKKKNIKVIFARGIPVACYYYFDTSLFHTSPKYTKLKTFEKNLSAFNYFIKKTNKNFNLIENLTSYSNYTIITNLLKKNNYFFFQFFFILKNFIKLLKDNLSIFIKVPNINIILNDTFKKKDREYLTVRDNLYSQNTRFFFSDIKKIKLYKFYNNLCTKAEPENEKYIFLPLWFQPSSTSYPYAGKFMNYVKIIKILDKALPKNWKIYVKESPDIFNVSNHAWYRSLNVRNNEFYLELLKSKRVKFINFDMPDHLLIDRSIATATLSDQFGLVSILRQKPNLNFANSVQNKFEGTFACRNLRDVNNAILKIKKGHKVDLRKVKSDINKLKKIIYFREQMKNFYSKKIKTNYKIMADRFEKALLNC